MEDGNEPADFLVVLLAWSFLEGVSPVADPSVEVACCGIGVRWQSGCVEGVDEKFFGGLDPTAMMMVVVYGGRGEGEMHAVRVGPGEFGGVAVADVHAGGEDGIERVSRLCGLVR